MKKYVLISALSLVIIIFTHSQLLAEDKTPPTITPTLTGDLGNNGWYVSNVTLSWKLSALKSAITSKSGCDTVTRSNDTSGATYTCKATTSDGTSIKSVTIKRDATPPSATITTPAAGATYKLNQKVTAMFTCGDNMSKMATCTGTVVNGGVIDTSTPGNKTFVVKAKDKAGNTATASASYIISAPATSSTPATSINGTHLFAWNDLGMHCSDSDFSVFTLLPPFNDLNAQLVVGGKLADSGYTITYEATAAPDGSLNSVSHTKTNFWNYALPLFGVSPSLDIGLTGNPMASSKPAPLTWESQFNWFEASGIPITPIDDNMHENYFPMVKVTAYDGTNKAIASTTAVLPVSSEINCGTCHASNTGNPAAKPVSGWVNLPLGSEKDWRMNILRLHDEKNANTANYTSLLTQKGYGSSLESSAVTGKPVLCDTCHNSNALAVWGISGVPGVSSMTAAMHNRHANVTLPGQTQTLDSIGTRDACYNCHPGKKTQCLRGAMGNPTNSNGNHTMECQSCHGSMLTVGNKARNGWFDMPTCQSCHHDGVRETVAINADGTFKTWNDIRFASNPNTPAQGWSLFRFSTGHGNLQCEACHNSTHAEFTDKPSANDNQANDNLRAIQAQSYAAAIRECTVCHATMPSSVNGGPHGMHNLGQSWVNSHPDAFGTTPKTNCYYCHGTTSAGSSLAVIKVAKTFNIDDGGAKTFAAGERVTCWSCHDGPNP